MEVPLEPVENTIAYRLGRWVGKLVKPRAAILIAILLFALVLLVLVAME